LNNLFEHTIAGGFFIMRFVVICLSLLSLFLSGGVCSVQAAEKTYTNSIGMEFILIPSGSFTMGADKNFEDAGEAETPQHRVTISKPFYLGKYEVTQGQWTAVMGTTSINDSKFYLEMELEQINIENGNAAPFVRDICKTAAGCALPADRGHGSAGHGPLSPVLQNPRPERLA
jgi:formylglycine-generating enzyme required for sulfatase activity